ncbi:MAG TPA: GEVED domain-containing protein, partial [Flavipsychrobacter sp.]|nr:GEVED domain-containing protein [Flavipsychrobacter sp.]
MSQQLLRSRMTEKPKRRRLYGVFAFLGLVVSIGTNQQAKAQCPVTQSPISATNCSVGDLINSLQIAGTTLPNMAGCNGQANGWRVNASPVFNLTIGSTYTYAYTTGTYQQGLAIWIDVNGNNIFDSAERLVAHASSSGGSGTFTIPTSAVPGSGRKMRVRCSYVSTPPATGACASQSYGETEDFTVNIIAPTNCSGMPTAGSVSTTGGTTFCGSGAPTFTVSGYSATNGISLQWQYSTNGGVTWNNYSGQTSSSLNPGTITQTTMVRVSVYCLYSGLTNTTTPVTITVNPYPTITTTASEFFNCTTSSNTISVSGTGSSYSWSPSTGLNTTSGSTVVASPSSTTTYTVTSTLGPCSTQQTFAVNISPMPTTTATATPSAVCSGESTQLSTLNTPSNYEIYAIGSGLRPTPGATVIGSPTVLVTSGDNDDGYATVSLPFNFTFYGTSYSTLYVGVNGHIGFNSSIGSVSPQNIPTATAPNDLIAIFWRDLHVGYSGSPSQITYATVGTSPNRKFIITYDKVATYGTVAPW